MRHSPEKHIEDALLACDELLQFTKEKQLADIQNDRGL